MRDCYLSLGANLGERERTLRRALELLAAADGVALWQVSSFYETAPWGKLDQPAFLNAAARVRTSLSPRALLAACQGIERRLGRVRREHWGARTIDIDLLAMPGVALATEELTLPHPYLAARAFVLVPLAEIAGGLRLEGTGCGGRTVRELLAACGDGSAVQRTAGSPADFRLALAACVDEGWGIGRENALLFSLPADMARFRQLTWGGRVLLGSRTLSSLPEGKPLAGRRHFVLSGRLGAREDITVCPSQEALWQSLREDGAAAEGRTFVIGGASVYAQLLPYVREAFVTRVGARRTADAFLENLAAREDFFCRHVERQREDGLELAFCHYIHGEDGSGLDGDFQE